MPPVRHFRSLRIQAENSRLNGARPLQRKRENRVFPCSTRCDALMTINAYLLRCISIREMLSPYAVKALSACRQFTFPHCKTYDKPSWNFDK
jgi:hypothetical protein